MKKIVFLAFFYFVFIFGVLDVYAEDDVADYLTYSEIMLSSGKLIRDFTDEERKQIYLNTEGVCFFGTIVYIENKAVDGSYISNTLYSIDNTSQTTIEYNLDYTVETNNKVSFQSTDTLNGSISGNTKKIKADLAAKATIDYSTQTTKSTKEKRSMKLEIEPNSRLIVYLTGDISITNGSFSWYNFYCKTYTGCFEFVTLKSQFSKMEKRSI